MAGLHLKPPKCVIIVSCIPISDDRAKAIKAWLADNVSDFKDFLIASSAKYLGWFLGVGSSELSWQEPLQKFTGRVEEIVSANAPATTAILRFNQRAVPVLSFVSQFSHPPVCADLPKLDQWSVHKLLRIPSHCMSRNLCHSVAFCTEVDPVPLAPFCSVFFIRFANSEREYLLSLHFFIMALHTNGDLSEPRSDISVLGSINTPSSSENMFDIPSGGFSDTPLLVNLLHAIHLSGPFS